MLKVVFPHSFANLGGPVARLVDLHRGGIDRDWMQKRAAVMTKELATIRPEKGHSFIHLISMGAGEYYGCFAAGTRIWRADGSFVPITQLAVGDHVVSGNGNIKPVAAVFDNGIRERILEVDLVGLPESLRMTPNHPVFGLRRSSIQCIRQKDCRCTPLTQNSSFRCGTKRFAHTCERAGTELDLTPEKLPIGELQEGDYVGLQLPLIEAEPLTPEFAWLLGLFAAEGSFGFYTAATGEKYPTTMSFGLHTKETDLVDRLEYVFNELYGLQIHVRQCDNTPNGIDVRVHSKAVATELYSLLGAGSSKLRVPLQLFGQSDSVKREFLQAYDAGDGCNPRPHESEIVTISPHLALGVQKLFWSLDIPASVGVRGVGGRRVVFDRLCNTHDVYHVRASGLYSKTAYSTARAFRWRNWMFVRIAGLADVPFGDNVYNIEVADDHTYVAEGISVGNSNRNGDIFNAKTASIEFPEPEPGGPRTKIVGPGLIDCHKTFMKYAHAFRDHVNRDPKQKIGDVYAEAYNPGMHRGELIVKVSNDKFADGLEKLARGEDLPFSMSARVAKDVCSICGHESASRREYCNHLKHEMGQVKDAGHQVYAINPNPCFFDISYVFRPADRIAYSLQKVASDGTLPEEFISSAEIADLWGITAPRSVLLDTSPRPVQEKLAALERMAAMEKQIEATGRLYSPEVDAAAPSSALPSDTADTLRSADWNGLMGALGQANICLPVKDFFRLVLGNKYDSVAGEMDNVQSLLPGMFSRMLKSSDGVEDVTGMQSYDPATSLVPKGVREAIEALAPNMSLGEEPVRRRVSITIIKGAKPMVTLRKSSSDRKPSSLAQYMARQYAGYQLAFARTAEGAGDRLAQGMAVLQNYVE